MLKILCLIVALGFFANALLHLLLLVGKPLGEFVLGGNHVILPYKIRGISLFFLLLWTVVGLCYLHYGDLIQLSVFDSIDRVLLIFTSIFLFFATFSNGFLTKSRKERLVMTPFCLISLMLSLLILFT